MTPSSRKTWFITGASSGFGHAFASYALEKGYNVVATARNPSKLGSLVAQGYCLADRRDIGRLTTLCRLPADPVGHRIGDLTRACGLCPLGRRGLLAGDLRSIGVGHASNVSPLSSRARLTASGCAVMIVLIAALKGS